MCGDAEPFAFAGRADSLLRRSGIANCVDYLRMPINPIGAADTRRSHIRSATNDIAATQARIDPPAINNVS